MTTSRTPDGSGVDRPDDPPDARRDEPPPPGGGDAARGGDPPPGAPRPRARLLAGPPFPFRKPSIMWRHIYTGAMASVYINLVAGLFLVAFGRRLGISYRAFGALGGLTSLTVALQLVGAQIAARSGNRRGVWFAFAMVERLARGAAIAVAFYASSWNVTFAAGAFVLLLALGSAFGALATPPWYSWLADLLPAEEQGTFWGRREAWIALATTAVIVPCALLYDGGRARGLETETLLAIFALGLLLGYLDLFIHRTIPEPPIRASAREPLRGQVAAVFRDRAFRPWLVFTTLWNFGMMLGAALSGIYLVDDLFSQSFTLGIAAVGVVPLGMQLLTSRRLGALVDRLGTRTVLRWSFLVWAFLPLPWIFATRETAAWWLAASNVVGMPAVSAAMNASAKYVTRFPRREERAMYWAVSTTLATLAGGLGAVISGEVLELVNGVRGPAVAGLGGFRMLFVVSMGLRLAALALTVRLPAPRHESAAEEGGGALADAARR